MPDSDRLNVVLIVTDQQRYDSLGCTGNAFAITPNLDALAAAEHACVFDRHFTAAPVCMPSRASTMTGCYPAAHGVWTNGIPLPRAQYTTLSDGVRAKVQQRNDPPGSCTLPSHHVTLPDAFAAAGYATASIGKLHLTPTQSHPDLGYEESNHRWAHDPAMNDWHGPYFGFQHVDLSLDHGVNIHGHYEHWLRAHHPDAAATVYRHLNEIERPTPLGDLFAVPIPQDVHPTMWCTDRAAARIDHYADTDQPFFMWVGIPDPHHPFTPPADLAAQFEQRETMPVAADPDTIDRFPQTIEDLRRGGHWQSDAKTTRLVRQYTDAMVHLIDIAVGRIIDRLKTRGLWDNTVLVFTSDHGDYLGDYGLLRKSDNACRVLNHTPLLARVPGRDLPARSATPISNTDLLPSLCDWCGIDAPQQLHGEAIGAVLRDGRRRPVLTQSIGLDADSTNLSLIDERYRLTWRPTQHRLELFDHAKDPMELLDLAAAGNGKAEAMLSTLQAAHCETLGPRIGRVSTW